MPLSGRYLEVTYRDGAPLAAYLYLARREGDTCARTEKVREGLVVDFSEDDRPIGVEITEPSRIDTDVVNDVLERLGVPGLSQKELAPVHDTRAP